MSYTLVAVGSKIYVQADENIFNVNYLTFNVTSIISHNSMTCSDSKMTNWRLLCNFNFIHTNKWFFEVLISMVQALLYRNKKNRKKIKLLKNIKFWSWYNIFNVPFLSTNLQKYSLEYEIYILKSHMKLNDTEDCGQYRRVTHCIYTT